MAKHTITTIDTQRITSVEAILQALQALTEYLPGSELQELVSFNKAYYIVTSVIKDAAAVKRFANPKFVEDFSVSFATLYFEALNDMLSRKTTVALAWVSVIEVKDKRTLPKFVRLLLGANAHINYDLPLALKQVIGDQKTTELLKDIATIDKLLVVSGRQIVSAFDEPNAHLDFLKRHFRFVYFRPLMYMVLFWRAIAWRNYRRLSKGSENIEYLDMRSTKIARRLVRLGNLLAKI